ncbi:MAG: AmmeMemoRadiSam system radical SAM enzyme [Deltaproteobacteria bacterium]|nr:AmmeMemoRadiSam system radical SAM enzyme [Deltaproteobacteria bacterium]
MDLTRRELIKAGIACTLAVSPADAFARWFSFPGKNEKAITQNDAPEKLWKWSKEVYNTVNLGRNVQCLTCPNQCILEPNARSRCRSHVNKNGKLYTLVYGNPCSVHVDPVEKKPLYHFLPSSGVLSIATTGCSFNCLNCQNWEISQARPEDVRFVDMFPDAVVEAARRDGCRGIAYTYSEPTTFYEYMLDTSRLAHEADIKNIWVSNGYINTPPLLALCKMLDGANIDIKSFSEDTYSRLNAGTLKPVLRTLTVLKEQGVWFEITALMVPTYTDTIDEVKRMCGWILENLGADYPLHFSRFYPRYKLTHLPPTSISFLEKARKTAMEMGIHYVYAGNVPQADSNHTYCPSCKKKIIERFGYLITENSIEDGKCSFCRQPIAGVWG